MKNKEIDELITGVQLDVQKGCLTCKNEVVAAIVARWLDRRASGGAVPSLHTLHRELLRKHGAPSMTSVRRHVEQCLCRDHNTGKTL